MLQEHNHLTELLVGSNEHVYHSGHAISDQDLISIQNYEDLGEADSCSNLYRGASYPVNNMNGKIVISPCVSVISTSNLSPYSEVKNGSGDS